MKTMIYCTMLIFIAANCTTVTRNNIVVLIDNSRSVGSETTGRYLDLIRQTLLRKLGPKDKMTLMFIDNCSRRMSERIFTVDLASIEFTNHQDGLNHQQDSLNARLARYLLTLESELNSTIADKQASRRSLCGNYSDILSALTEMRSLLEVNKQQELWEKIANSAVTDSEQWSNSVIILSDMVQEDGVYDFRRLGGLSYREVTDLAENVALPADLTGVKVYVYGATCSNKTNCNAQIANIQLFWQTYFDRASAAVGAYGYDTKAEIERGM